MITLTYNINNDYRDLEDKALAIWELIQKNDVDVAGLQEVTPNQYDTLIRHIIPGYFVSEKIQQTFFNVMIWRGNASVSYHPFVNSSMSRGFLVLNFTFEEELSFVTTHLESGVSNVEMRKRQCDEILQNLADSPAIIFGDMNFCNPSEEFVDLLYLKPHRPDIFTYDSKHNRNATPPFRSDLDRFYSKANSDNHLDFETEILMDSRFSDHFPVLINNSTH